MAENVIRYELSSTNRHADTLVRLIQAEQTRSIRIFASSRDEAKAALSDLPATNFPLVAALVEYEVPGIEDSLFIVFDGVLLTAARENRADEVRYVLDHAVKSGKVHFGIEPAPFTSSLSAQDAKVQLEALETLPLDEEGRPLFWYRLSGVSEAGFDAMKRDRR